MNYIPPFYSEICETGRPKPRFLSRVAIYRAIPRPDVSVSLRHTLVMVALCNRADHNIFMLFLSSSSFFFSSPNLSRRRFDVYRTLAHGVALVRI